MSCSKVCTPVRLGLSVAQCVFHSRKRAEAGPVQAWRRCSSGAGQGWHRFVPLPLLAQRHVNAGRAAAGLFLIWLNFPMPRAGSGARA